MTERDASGLTPGAPALDVAVEAELRRALAGIRHGSITLIVQDGRVVQIDATSKRRFAAERCTSPQVGRSRKIGTR